MSFIPSPYLVRLQELKLWQGNYDNWLQNSKSQNATLSSDLDDIDDLPPDENTDMNAKILRDVCSKTGITDWDKKTISPSKPFIELLEEKLSEDIPNNVLHKPKQPFLKKGSGLARFNINTNLKIPASKLKISKSKLNAFKNEVAQRNGEKKENELTPLKLPDISFKCMATWSKVNEIDNEFVPLHKSNSENFVEKIHNYNINNLISSSKNNHKINEDEANRSERELRIFEVLEEKVERSSFSSTNSSIIRLLSGNPNCQESPKNSECTEENSEVLTKILQNLKLYTHKGSCEHITDIQTKGLNTNISFSDTEGDTDIHSQTISSFYTDFEHTLGKAETTDVAVNTSFVDKSESIQTQFDRCIGCMELRKKLDKLERELPNIIAEKAKMYDFVKELEKKRDQLYQENENLKKARENDITDLREELEKEKMKFAREKALLDTYLKDTRSSKTDREQILILKKEITDVKELMKLKETKNGTTQARLRNQIKQLEKEKIELKSSLENLQKENSKLNANCKVNRNVETKMLQEINRNLHRLTEETKQLKSDTPLNKEKDIKQQKKSRRKSMGDLKDHKTDREVQSQINKTSYYPDSPTKKKNEENSEKKNSPEIEVIYNNTSVLSDLEKRYESTFGLHTANGDHLYNLKNTSNSEQENKIISEKEFPDGSQEIKYSNGASKIISPDRQCIFVQYANGDIKETNLNKNIKKYYFIAKDVWVTRYSDGIELVEFPNGQKEKKNPNGKLEVTTADGTQLITFPNGTQEINYPDGSKMINANNEKIIYLPNGQKETHNSEFKKREYPDGTVKILYPDGTQESRYASGRIRIKDAHGTLILDSYANKT